MTEGNRGELIVCVRHEIVSSRDTDYEIDEETGYTCTRSIQSALVYPAAKHDCDWKSRWWWWWTNRWSAPGLGIVANHCSFDDSLISQIRNREIYIHTCSEWWKFTARWARIARLCVGYVRRSGIVLGKLLRSTGAFQRFRLCICVHGDSVLLE